MATTTCSRQQEKTGTWSNIFPTEQVTQQQSALFVKKLLAVSVSSITYLRAIFPEHAFGDRCLEDLNLKILRDDTACAGACQVIKWMKGCFDALDKKYLKMLIVGIYVDPNDPETVIESYTFKFTYGDDGGIDIYRNNKKLSSAYTEAETKKATIRLLRTIVLLTQTLTSLPDDVMMTMKLAYYDDVTPADYEPPGFKASDSDCFRFEEEPMNIKVGDVATPFHTVKLRIKTDAKQFEIKDDPMEEEVATDDNTSAIQRDNESGLKQNQDKEENINDLQEVDDSASHEGNQEEMHDVQQPFQCEDVPTENPAQPIEDGEDKEGEVTGSQQSAAMEGSQGDMGVDCPCGCNEDDGLMILCSLCKCWQHGVCFLVNEESEAPEIHICNRCAKPDDPNAQPTDPHLTGLNQVATQATCLWRRALWACSDLKRVLLPNFSRRLGVEMTVCQGLVGRLEKEGVLKAPGKGKNSRLGKLVIKDKLDAAIQKYFKKVDNSEKVRDVAQEQPQVSVDAPMSIDKLSERAEALNLSGKRKKTPKKAEKGQKEVVIEEQQIQVPDDKKSLDQKNTSNEKKRGQKRAFSVTAQQDFEVSNSQDMSQDDFKIGTRAKRRKGSVVNKAIMV